MYEANNQKATLVALNYNFANINEFIEKLNSKDILKKYNLEQQEQIVKFSSSVQPPASILNDVRQFLPLKFVSKDTTIEIVYTQQELKLLISKKNIDEKSFSDYAKLSNDFIDLKLSDLTAIGMNYSAEFNLKDEKLLLLRDETVEAVPNFEQNISFEFILPLKDEKRGVLSTYRIRKIDNDCKDHKYEISVNFHYAIEKMTTSEKANKVNEIISLDMYKEFEAQCQRFLGLNNG